MGAAPYALSPDLRIIPQHLTRLGYEARAVGKWHLGSHTASVTPTHRYNLICPVFNFLCLHFSDFMLFRGFLSHVGYWTGHEDYYDHSAQELYGPVVRG